MLVVIPVARNMILNVFAQWIVVNCLVVRSCSVAEIQTVHAYAQVAESLVNGRFGVYKH